MLQRLCGSIDYEKCFLKGVYWSLAIGLSNITLSIVLFSYLYVLWRWWFLGLFFLDIILWIKKILLTYNFFCFFTPDWIWKCMSKWSWPLSSIYYLFYCLAFLTHLSIDNKKGLDEKQFFSFCLALWLQYTEFEELDLLARFLNKNFSNWTAFLPSSARFVYTILTY